jgi:hypothetical protein
VCALIYTYTTGTTSSEPAKRPLTVTSRENATHYFFLPCSGGELDNRLTTAPFRMHIPRSENLDPPPGFFVFAAGGETREKGNF